MRMNVTGFNAEALMFGAAEGGKSAERSGKAAAAGSGKAYAESGNSAGKTFEELLREHTESPVTEAPATETAIAEYGGAEAVAGETAEVSEGGETGEANVAVQAFTRLPFRRAAKQARDSAESEESPQEVDLSLETWFAAKAERGRFRAKPDKEGETVGELPIVIMPEIETEAETLILNPQGGLADEFTVQGAAQNGLNASETLTAQESLTAETQVAGAQTPETAVEFTGLSETKAEGKEAPTIEASEVEAAEHPEFTVTVLSEADNGDDGLKAMIQGFIRPVIKEAPELREWQATRELQEAPSEESSAQEAKIATFEEAATVEENGKGDAENHSETETLSENEQPKTQNDSATAKEAVFTDETLSQKIEPKADTDSGKSLGARITKQVAEAVIAKAAALKGNGTVKFTITLNPENLGKITIKLAATGTKLAIEVIAERAETRALLLSRADGLQSALAKNGNEVEEYRVNEPDKSFDYSEQDGGGGKRGRQQEQRQDEPQDEVNVSFSEMVGAMMA